MNFADRKLKNIHQSNTFFKTILQERKIQIKHKYIHKYREQNRVILDYIRDISLSIQHIIKC